jgi:hypothetical protein
MIDNQVARLCSCIKDIFKPPTNNPQPPMSDDDEAQVDQIIMMRTRASHTVEVDPPSYDRVCNGIDLLIARNGMSGLKTQRRTTVL